MYCIMALDISNNFSTEKRRFFAPCDSITPRYASVQNSLAADRGYINFSLLPEHKLQLNGILRAVTALQMLGCRAAILT